MRHQNQSITPIYAVREWEISESSFDKANNFRSETIFALGNGYFGTRGTFEEGLPTPPQADHPLGREGSFINAFYESEPIRYPESAFGFAENSQTMLNITNGKVIQLTVMGEQFNLLSGQVLGYQRVLSLRDGTLTRQVRWRSPQGHEIMLKTQRLVSFTNRQVMAIWYEVTPLNFNGEVTITALLDGAVSNVAMAADPRVGSGLAGQVLLTDDRDASADGRAWLVQHTKNTNFALVCAMTSQLTSALPHMVTIDTQPARAAITYTVDAEQDQPITLYKYVVYCTAPQPELSLLAQAQQIAAEAAVHGYAHLAAQQRAYLDRFWERADVIIEGDPATQQGIRFNLFHLLQSVGKDGRTNIAAKGLTGEGYEGHYFWDTEMYIVPLFIYTDPTISRKLLEYRYSILDKARERARQMSHPIGALFPWRTINGEECSAYYPAGTAQYHINADIAFAIRQYMNATQDVEFLHNYGAEILFETARLWANLGGFVPRKGDKFCINCVTGPDEYTAIVNNNCYTNMMAQENLWYACQVAADLQANAPSVYARIAEAIHLDESELAFWQRAADRMFIPYDEALGIYEQDDSFLDKLPWDFANTPSSDYPLLLHHHPLVIYRHQVCKQADLVLALFLLSHRFSMDEKRRNYQFYQQFTTHDSSLSTCIFSIVASDIGLIEEAYDFFHNTARMDLDDFHHNTKDGIHAANMAGTWLSIVNGFGGLRVYEGWLHFKPALPTHWQSYTFNVTYQGRWLQVQITPTNTTYTLREGQPFAIKHGDQTVDLQFGQVVSIER